MREQHGPRQGHNVLQVENEYGYCGSDKAYLRHLLASARQQLGGNVILFTTDPPDLAHLGSLPGDAVYTCALECSQRCEFFWQQKVAGRPSPRKQAFRVAVQTAR